LLASGCTWGDSRRYKKWTCDFVLES